MAHNARMATTTSAPALALIQIAPQLPAWWQQQVQEAAWALQLAELALED